MSSHHRSLSEPFSVASLTNQEPPPPLPQNSDQIAQQQQQLDQELSNADIANSQKRPSSAFAKKSEAEKKKPFKCDRAGCGMAFSRQEHLLRHIRKHTGEKPFACRVCGNSFSRLDNLRQHSQCHERKRRVRNNRRVGSVRTGPDGGALPDVQQQADQPVVYPNHTAQVLSPMAATAPQPSSVAGIMQEARPIRRRPDPIVLPHDGPQYGQREMVTPPESPASQFANAPPSPFSPYTNSVSSISSTPTTGNFMMPSPESRSGYNTPYNRYSWSVLDSSLIGSPAEARTPKSSRRQTLMAPPANIASMLAEPPSAQPSEPSTPREPYQQPPGLVSPRGESSWFGAGGRPKTWHGGPPNLTSPPPQLPALPQPRPNPTPVNSRKRNSQVFDGDGNRPTLEPDIMSGNEMDELAIRALGLGMGMLQPGNRSSLAESTPTSRRYSNTFANVNVNALNGNTISNFSNGLPPVTSIDGPSRYYATNGERMGSLASRLAQANERQTKRLSQVYGENLGQSEMIPRSIAEEGGTGLGGLCALVSAVELQNNNHR